MVRQGNRSWKRLRIGISNGLFWCEVGAQVQSVREREAAAFAVNPWRWPSRRGLPDAEGNHCHERRWSCGSINRDNSVIRVARPRVGVSFSEQLWIPTEEWEIDQCLGYRSSTSINSRLCEIHLTPPLPKSSEPRPCAGASVTGAISRVQIDSERRYFSTTWLSKRIQANEDGTVVVHADLRCGDLMLSLAIDCSCGSGLRPVRDTALAELSVPSSSESHTVWQADEKLRETMI
jgi:hypothetical protein